MLRIFFAVMFLFLSCLLNGCYSQNEKAPAVGEKKEAADTDTVDPYLWDFGKIKQGEIVKHTFILKNNGTKAFSISQVNTSCGCTASEAKKKKLNPAESTEIQVSFNSKGYLGPIKQFIYVNTDDIDNPVFKFTIQASVIKDYKQTGGR